MVTERCKRTALRGNQCPKEEVGFGLCRTKPRGQADAPWLLRDRTARESPTLATTSLLPMSTAATAVQPSSLFWFPSAARYCWSVVAKDSAAGRHKDEFVRAPVKAFQSEGDSADVPIVACQTLLVRCRDQLRCHRKSHIALWAAMRGALRFVAHGAGSSRRRANGSPVLPV